MHRKLQLLARTAGRTVCACKSLPSIANVPVSVIARSITDDQRARAKEELKKAVRELSQAPAVAVSAASVATLLEWDKADLKSLPIENLEELARSWFDGVDGELERNANRAVEVWKVAVEKGSVEAKYSLAVCTRQGLGVEKDPVKAFQAMEQLANEKNYGLAHFATGIMFHVGEGTKQDLTKAFQHFKSAALAGVAPALHNLANAFAEGQGVEKNEAEAIKLYEAAVQVGDPSAKFTLGTWLYRGRGGLTVDKKRAFALQLEAAQAGHPRAMFNTGAAYMSGEAEPQDFNKAVEWFEKAANRGMIEASVNLGSMYRTGLGVPKDLNKAAAAFAKFAPYHKVSAELLKAVQEEQAAEAGKT